MGSLFSVQTNCRPGDQFEPKGLFLSNPGVQQSFLVTASDGQGNLADVTDLCRITSADPDVVRVDSKSYRLSAESAGETTIEVRLEQLVQAVPVRVGERASEVAVRFAPDVVSILTTKGCNGSDCHGSPAGQNGFKLSLFGYDVAAITRLWSTPMADEGSTSGSLARVSS